MNAGREITSWSLLGGMQFDASPVSRRSSETNPSGASAVGAEGEMKRRQYVVAIRICLEILLVLRAGRRESCWMEERNGLKRRLCKRNLPIAST